MALISQNGYIVLQTNRTTGPLPRLRKTVVPGTGRHLYLRDGSVCFLLAHFAHWYTQNIDPLGRGLWDEWGWAVRPVRGQTSGYSNHASGTAEDLDAVQHPRGVATTRTFTAAEQAKIHEQLKVYEGCIRWGGDYRTVPDGMHFEMDRNLAAVERVARKLWDSKHGKPVIAANPGLATVIWDGKVPGLVPSPAPAVLTRIAADWSYAWQKFMRLHEEVRDANVRGVMRYLSGNEDKDITAAEARSILAHGMWLLLAYEKSAKRAADGRAAGVADAKAADAQADRTGYPRSACIIYTVDWDAAPATVKAYFEGVHDTSKRPVGVYGSKRIGDAVVGQWKLARYFWQTVGWSGGEVSDYANMLQYPTTRKTRSIDGAASKDWDENKIIPGPVIPVWNPGDAAFKPEPATPKPSTPKPTLPKATSVVKVNAPEVLPLESSDHRAVVLKCEFGTGQKFHTGHANLQGTDPSRTVQKYIDWLIPQAGLWGLNEVTRLVDQQAVYDLKGVGKYMHGIEVVNGKIKKKADSAAVALVWDLDVWEKIAVRFKVLVEGAAGFTPVRVLPRVLFRHKVSGDLVWRPVTHTPHHIDQDGKARWTGTLLGQNERAKTCYAKIASDVETAKTEVLPGIGGPAPLIGSGDLNVDFVRDRERTLAGTGTKWFPYTVLGGVADILKPNTHEDTHGDRMIDWFWVSQAK